MITMNKNYYTNNKFLYFRYTIKIQKKLFSILKKLTKEISRDI